MSTEGTTTAATKGTTTTGASPPATAPVSPPAAAPAGGTTPAAPNPNNISFRHRQRTLNNRTPSRQAAGRAAPAPNPNAVPGAAAAPTQVTTAAPGEAASHGAPATAPNLVPALGGTAPAIATSLPEASAVSTTAGQPTPAGSTLDPGLVPGSNAIASPPGTEPLPATAAGEVPGASPASPSGSPDWLQEALAEAALPDGAQRTVKKLVGRIHEVIDQRDAERNARLEAERKLAGTPAAAEPQSEISDSRSQIPSGPFVPDGALQQFDAQLAQLNQALDWAEQNPDGGQLRDAKGQPYEADATAVRTWQRQWADQRTALLARRETHAVNLQQQAQVRLGAALTEARTAYPWMADRNSPEYAEAAAFIRTREGVTLDPEWPLVVGAYVSAKMARKSRAAVPALPPVVAPPLTRARAAAAPTPVVTTASPAAPVLNETQRKLQEVEQRIATQGNMTLRDRRELTALRRQAAATR